MGCKGRVETSGLMRASIPSPTLCADTQHTQVQGRGARLFLDERSVSLWPPFIYHVVTDYKHIYALTNL